MHTCADDKELTTKIHLEAWLFCNNLLTNHIENFIMAECPGVKTWNFQCICKISCSFSSCYPNFHHQFHNGVTVARCFDLRVFFWDRGPGGAETTACDGCEGRKNEASCWALSMSKCSDTLFRIATAYFKLGELPLLWRFLVVQPMYNPWQMSAKKFPERIFLNSHFFMGCKYRP